MKNKKFLVGDSLTLADIFLTVVQLELQQCILDIGFAKSLSNLTAHFKLVTSLPEFKKRLGNVKPGKKQILPPFNEEKPKSNVIESKEKKKEKSKQTAKG